MRIAFAVSLICLVGVANARTTKFWGSQDNDFGGAVGLGTITAAELPGFAPRNGYSIYCKDCNQNCAGGGMGAEAFRMNGIWNCAFGQIGSSTLSSCGGEPAGSVAFFTAPGTLCFDGLFNWNAATGSLKAGQMWDLGGAVFNVKAFGAIGDSTNGSDGTDNTIALQAAINAANATNGGAAGGAIVFAPPGNYRVTSSLLLYGNVTLAGSGRNTQIIMDNSATTPGWEVFRVATPNTCVGGGAGSCDTRMRTGGRGPGCTCHHDADCTSNNCTTGTGQRRIQIRDMGIVVKRDNSIGIDATLMSESVFRNLWIAGAVNGYVNRVGVYFDDGGTDTTLTGYSDELRESQIGNDFDVCIQLDGTGNDNRITHNVIGNACHTGVLVGDLVDTARIEDNLFQTSRASACTASACVGGAANGKTCSTATDCDAHIWDKGDSSTIFANRFEDVRDLPFIRLGCSVGANGCSANEQSQLAFVASNKMNSPVSNPSAIVITSAAREQIWNGSNHIDSDNRWLNRIGNVGFDGFFFGPTTTAPQTCATAWDGLTYYDTDIKDVCVCSNQNLAGTFKWCRITDRWVCSGGSTTNCTGTDRTVRLLSVDPLSQIVLGDGDNAANGTPWLVGGHTKNQLYGINKLTNIAITSSSSPAVSNPSLAFGTLSGAQSPVTIATTGDSVQVEAFANSGVLPANVFSSKTVWYVSSQFRGFGPFPQSVTVEARYTNSDGAACDANTCPYVTIASTTTALSPLWVATAVFSPAITAPPTHIFGVRWTFTNWSATGSAGLISLGLAHQSETTFPAYLRRDGDATSKMLAPLAWSDNLGAITHIQGPTDQNLKLVPGGANKISLQGGLWPTTNAAGALFNDGAGVLAYSGVPIYFGTAGTAPAGGSATFFAGLSGSFSTTTEGLVQAVVPAGTYKNLRCVPSATPGGTGIAISARAGTCGAQAASGSPGTMTATVVTANTPVNDTTNSVTVTAGQCFDFQMVQGATTTASAVNCVVERIS